MKAVIPVAGFGTRFLPATRSIPKELFPIVDKPIIQYSVEEAYEAGIKEFILVNSPNKGSVDAHFKVAEELEKYLNESGKEHYLQSLVSLREQIKLDTVTQEKPLGLGHAILRAKNLVGNNDFAVILPDDLIATNNSNCLQQMMEVYNENRCGIIAVEPVADADTEKYGIVRIESGTVKTSRIKGIIEKPKTKDAPSRLGVVGRYILPAAIFDSLESTSKGSGNEIQLTDAIANLLSSHEFIAYQFDGTRYDCGSKLGYLQANVEFGLKHKDIGTEFMEYLSGLKLDKKS